MQVGSLRRVLQRVHRASVLVGAESAGGLAGDVTSLASSPVSRVPARAVTSLDPAALAVPGTPGTSRRAVAMAARPASSWITMYEAIT